MTGGDEEEADAEGEKERKGKGGKREREKWGRRRRRLRREEWGHKEGIRGQERARKWRGKIKSKKEQNQEKMNKKVKE